MTATSTPIPNAEAWLSAFVVAAFVAEDDPEMCIELARQMRIVGEEMDIPKRLADKAENRPAAQ